jgi:hypothetical protein
MAVMSIDNRIKPPHLVILIETVIVEEKLDIFN